MEITIKNSKEPKYARHDKFVEFKLTLRRNGDKIVLDIPAPHCFRNFNQFTKGEKEAYHAIVQHILDTAGKALRDAEVK